MTSYEWNGTLWLLPPATLQPDSDMRLGEFVDSKQAVKQMTDMKVRKQEYSIALATIFLRKEGELFEERFMYPGSERLQLMKTLPLDIAQDVDRFYDGLSSFINENFTVFHPSKGQSGVNIAKHFAFWGWLEFVVEVAKAPEFLISGSGMTGFQCARAAKLYDVLVWASANKERNEAEYLDHKAEMESNKL